MHLDFNVRFIGAQLDVCGPTHYDYISVQVSLTKEFGGPQEKINLPRGRK